MYYVSFFHKSNEDMNMCEKNRPLVRAIPEKTPGGGRRHLFILPNHPWNSSSSDTNHPCN